jgi:CRISPR/Cas system-associated exonuclease Cas4 (RecB family)
MNKDEQRHKDFAMAAGEMRDNILDYLENEKSINEDGPIQDTDSEIRIMREKERIKLRDRIYELKRHIEVIKRMYPNGNS